METEKWPKAADSPLLRSRFFLLSKYQLDNLWNEIVDLKKSVSRIGGNARNFRSRRDT